MELNGEDFRVVISNAVALEDDNPLVRKLAHEWFYRYFKKRIEFDERQRKETRMKKLFWKLIGLVGAAVEKMKGIRK